MEVVESTIGGGSRIKKLITIAVAVVAAGVALYNWMEVRELKKIAERCRAARLEQNEDNKRLKKQRDELAGRLKEREASPDNEEETVEIGSIKMKLTEAVDKLTTSEAEVMRRVALMDSDLNVMRKEIHENYAKRNKYMKLARSIRTCTV